MAQGRNTLMDPPIEDLLDKVDSKFTLVALGSARARQVNSYYNSLGEGLGKTTGWVHRLELKKRGVRMTAGASYQLIDDAGLHVEIAGRASVIAVDTIVVCAGQEPERSLVGPLAMRGLVAKLIGGADVAAELDAKRAIRQGAELAASL